MSDRITLQYTEIYSEINELKNFVELEIKSSSDQAAGTISGAAEEMSGKTNDQLVENIYIQNQKAKTVSNVLFTILDYIENSTKEMERLDNEISGIIDKEV